MILTLFLIPVLLSILVLIARSRTINILSTLIYGVAFLAISVALYLRPDSFTKFFRVDGLNILFLLILAVIFFGTAFYMADYLRRNKAHPWSQALFTVNLLIFIASMAGVILSSHLALLWVFVEATTLSSSYLIYFSRSESSLEATWKYLFICSIGITVAFVGIIFLSTGLGKDVSLFFDDLYLHASTINTFWLRLAFPFMLVGFGTKVGLGPVHAWLPDAHSESPSPVSALLSGTLLNAAFLGIIRVNRLMKLADLWSYARILLIIMGFISLFTASVYIINIKNYKRMLAYSSVENMGIIAIGLGIGGAAQYAALLHLAGHSLAKGAFFLTSGNILHRYGTREIDGVSGLLRSDKITGWLWIICFAAISGFPPSPLFVSEFIMAKTLLQGNTVLAVCFFLFLTIIIAGMGSSVLKMCFGSPGANIPMKPANRLSLVPQILFLALLAYTGISMPAFMSELFTGAAACL